MRSLVQPLLKAQAERYRTAHILTAAATTISDQPPYVIHSTIVGQGEPWATLSDDGRTIPDARMVSSAAAFAYYALFPTEPYTQELWKAIVDSADSPQGYSED